MARTARERFACASSPALRAWQLLPPRSWPSRRRPRKTARQRGSRPQVHGLWPWSRASSQEGDEDLNWRPRYGEEDEGDDEDDVDDEDDDEAVDHHEDADD